MKQQTIKHGNNVKSSTEQHLTFLWRN
uniref:Uncharacterized protein n=1 Tax=Rhizophora mucronata TaxID=61149 RepID=A0A2P2PK11_RHIMU